MSNSMPFIQLGDDKQKTKNNAILYCIPNLYNILLHIYRLCIVIVCVLHNSDSKGIYYILYCVQIRSAASACIIIANILYYNM